MYVAFRTDVNATIGSGHLARCRRLAAGLRQAGCEILFLIRNPLKKIYSELTDEGNNVQVLSSSFLRDSELDDANETKQALLERRPDWLVVDNYSLGIAWEIEMRQFAHQLMVIDDLGRPHECDLLLDQGYLGDDTKSYFNVNGKKLLGPQFALLDPEFSRIRTMLRKSCKSFQRVLVFFGGADATQQTLRVLEAIEDNRFSSLRFDVVVGEQNALSNEIQRFGNRLANVNILGPQKSLVTLMCAADLFVGAGGTTTWERCCLGLPAIVCWTAENQKAQTVTLAALGVHLELGNAIEQTSDSWRTALLAWIADPKPLKLGAIRGMGLVDGRGLDRVVGCMTNVERVSTLLDLKCSV